jgi:hypothetical protein
MIRSLHTRLLYKSVNGSRAQATPNNPRDSLFLLKQSPTPARSFVDFMVTIFRPQIQSPTKGQWCTARGTGALTVSHSASAGFARGLRWAVISQLTHAYPT